MPNFAQLGKPEHWSPPQKGWKERTRKRITGRTGPLSTVLSCSHPQTDVSVKMHLVVSNRTLDSNWLNYDEGINHLTYQQILRQGRFQA